MSKSLSENMGVDILYPGFSTDIYLVTVHVLKVVIIYNPISTSRVTSYVSATDMISLSIIWHHIGYPVIFPEC